MGRGGLTDIDFILQLIQIREGHTQPAFRVAGTRRLLAESPATAFLHRDEWQRLREAYKFLRTMETLVRLDADSSVSWISRDPVVMNAIGSRMRLGDARGGRLLAQYRDVTERVRAIYTAVIERLKSTAT